tara:strand:+ start:898 stop:1437 length:540 start_codon:yes stop_codon:yes gene_type:complete
MTLPLITLNLWITITLDIVLWFIFHLGAAKIAVMIPDHFYEKPIPNYVKTKPIEKFFLKKIFQVNKWKKFSPDGGAYFKKGFSKRYLKEKNLYYYEKFLIETRRAELTHYLAMVLSPIFFIFNPNWIGWNMVAFAIIFNLPFILIQKYNQPRIINLIIKTRSRQNNVAIGELEEYSKSN